MSTAPLYLSVTPDDELGGLCAEPAGLPEARDSRRRLFKRGAVVLFAAVSVLACVRGVAPRARPATAAPRLVAANVSLEQMLAELPTIHGEEACEGHHYTRFECRAVGCCQYHGACHSDVGGDVCEAAKINGEVACENRGFHEDSCLAVGCCQWDDEKSRCFSNVENRPCIDHGLGGDGSNGKVPKPTKPPPGRSGKLDTSCDRLPKHRVWELDRRGMKQRLCPFNILVAASSDYPAHYLEWAAGIVAELVDRDGDNQCDDDMVCALLSFTERTELVYLGGGTSRDQEKKCEGMVAAYCFSMQTWHCGSSFGSTDHGRCSLPILTEEAFHMVHQMGWAKAYPEALGVDGSWSSILAKECKRLACVEPGWSHPENKCPAPVPRKKGNPAHTPLEGTCSDETCDCVEFYQQALLSAVGQKPGWESDLMPDTRQGLLRMLSEPFKKMIANPKYNQPTRPLSYNRLGKAPPRRLSDGPAPLANWTRIKFQDAFGEPEKAEAGDHGMGRRRRSHHGAFVQLSN